ncbi:hypothetical protein [Pseudogemmobacter sp. W21_MBD1_M6]|uniref:hypothetical protein n=1 Tax=Pseudogemmobacter sp. W21_MBD1_M6 TaxID=3240271 RepID=UPI003F9D27CA
MKPNFVLDFSHDGIRLLHRTTGGWTLVGEVSLDTENSGTSIGFLRQTALAMEPHGLATKLVIPNSQILFKTIDIPGPTDADRTRQIAAALDGLTPYDVDDLVFDWRASGDSVQVAAVAKETLAEAEDFATQHKMNPVSFVAIPDADTFAGEPFFGVTKAHQDKARTDPVEQDDSTIVVLGAVKDAPPKTAPDAVAPTPVLVDTQPPVTKETQVVPPRSTDKDRSFGTVPPQLPASKIAPLPPLPAAKETPRVSGIAEGVLASTAAASLTPGTRSSDVKKAVTGQAMAAPADTKQAMTVFGARKTAPMKGAARYRALILTLTLTLLVILAITAFLSSFVVGNGLSGLIGTSDQTTVVAIENDAPSDEAMADEALADEADLALMNMPDALPADIALAETELPEMDSEDPLLEPDLAMPDARPAPMTLQEARTAYAANGVWQIAPDQGPLPPETDLDALYVASIDPVIASQDAIALPTVSKTPDDIRPPSRVSPPSVGTVFSLNAKGNVTPTAKGTLTPEGVMVFAGRPAKAPKPRTTPEEAPITAQTQLAGPRPKPRPAGLVEKSEKVLLGGRLRSELAGLKPRVRPESAQQAAEQVAKQVAEQVAEQDLADAVANDVASAVANNPPPVITGTKLAVARSRVPSSRPSNIASLADRANKQTEARSAALIPASVAPNKAPTEEETADEPELASVAPRIPSSASVTRQATVTKAIKLNKVNLIGVFGTPSRRRALVRLPNGKFVKLKVGDRVDGGKVAAIGTAELRYVKSGRNVVLTMPKG